MICKLFIEEGNYLDIETGESRNLMCAEVVYTPSGQSEEWLEFESIKKAIEYYKIKIKPIPEEHIGLDPLSILQLKQN
jgi:hypothetical protein